MPRYDSDYAQHSSQQSAFSRFKKQFKEARATAR
jgi:hypothetical protein